MRTVCPKCKESFKINYRNGNNETTCPHCKNVTYCYPNFPMIIMEIPIDGIPSIKEILTPNEIKQGVKFRVLRTSPLKEDDLEQCKRTLADMLELGNKNFNG